MSVVQIHSTRLHRVVAQSGQSVGQENTDIVLFSRLTKTYKSKKVLVFSLDIIMRLGRSPEMNKLFKVLAGIAIGTIAENVVDNDGLPSPVGKIIGAVVGVLV